MKEFYLQYNIGKAKYCVSTHDGQSFHKDGSKFFGISIFKNLKKLNAYIKELKSQNYIES